MDPHLILTQAFEGVVINDRITKIVTYNFSERSNFSKIGSYIFVLSQNIKLVKSIIKITKANSNTHILVREFSNSCLLLLALLIFPQRGRIVFNINHNLKNIENRFPFALYILAKLGFNFLMLDGYYLQPYIPRSIRDKILVHTFPCRPSLKSRANNNDPNRHLNIGIVGDFRSEKGSILEITKAVKEIVSLKFCTVCIGARNSSFVQQNFKDAEIKAISTDTPEQYYDFLNKLDILLIFAKRTTYFSRHSGTIMDAIGCGVVTLTPEFPVFKSQLKIPIDVGMTYNSLEEIKNTVIRAIDQLYNFHVNISEYIALRDSPLRLYTKHD